MTDMKGISRRSFLTLGPAVLGGSRGFSWPSRLQSGAEGTSMAETGSATEEDWAR